MLLKNTLSRKQMYRCWICCPRLCPTLNFCIPLLLLLLCKMDHVCYQTITYRFTLAFTCGSKLRHCKMRLYFKIKFREQHLR